jgi:hypothetical protein
MQSGTHLLCQQQLGKQGGASSFEENGLLDILKRSFFWSSLERSVNGNSEAILTILLHFLIVSSIFPLSCPTVFNSKQNNYTAVSLEFETLDRSGG